MEMNKAGAERDFKITPPVIGSSGDESKGPFSLARVAQALLHFRPPPAPAQPDSEHPIRIVCTSDTHNSTPNLPPGDILIHSGDLTQYGTFPEMQAQLDWLKSQTYPHKIVIAGNHDLILDKAFVKEHPDRELDKPGSSAQDLDWGDLIYLEEEAVEITCGSRILKFFGSPYIPYCGTYAFQYDPQVDRWNGLIPNDTDIVITHGPPALHRDRDVGCPFLLEALWRVQPTLHVFGHMHHLRGREELVLSQSQRLFESLALGTSSWIKLPLLLWFGVKEWIWPAARTESITLVNAACFKGESSFVVSL
jgi:hypothetical protein